MPYGRRRYGGPRRASRYHGRRRYNGGNALSARNGYIAPSRRGYVRNTGFFGRFTGYDKEYKFLDYFYEEDFSVLNTGFWSASRCLNGIEQGTGPSQRIGRKVVLHGFSMNLLLRVRQSASTTLNNYDTPSMRVCIVVDTQNNGAVSTAASDVFVSALAPATAFPNLENKNRFRFILDKVYTAAPFDAGVHCPDGSSGAEHTWNNGSTRLYSFRKALRVPLEFAGTSGVQSELRSNNIFVLWTLLGTGASIAAPPNSHYSMFTRLRFSDS